MSWTPISIEALNGMIEVAEYELSEAEKIFWEMIKITPIKWRQSPWGDEGKGFWVVARMGDKVVYYNDIEDGFNTSRYRNEGVIDEYHCSQTNLSEYIKSCTARVRCA